jgi:hypothetical protein
MVSLFTSAFRVQDLVILEEVYLLWRKIVIIFLGPVLMYDDTDTLLGLNLTCVWPVIFKWFVKLGPS